jgi:predicted XRE-type DNA-binding protein
MPELAPDLVTIETLRSDLALQISRCLQRRQLTQVAAAKLLDVPQPTLSKIANGRVAELSLELLIRIAVRAGLPVVLQTGDVPEEAGVYLSGARSSGSANPQTSKLAVGARDSLNASARKLTPEQRLNAMLQQSQLVSQLHQAGNAVRRTKASASR